MAENSRDQSSIHEDDMLPELLMEVFVRLPAKSLMRFKSVSKHWFSLITSPYFVQMYQTRFDVRESGGVLLVQPPDTSRYDNIQLHQWDRRFVMIDWRRKDPNKRASIHDPTSLPYDTNSITNIANGLICFYHRVKRKGYITLYNLTTRENLPIPFPDPLPMASLERTCHLGFDPINKVYKILLIRWPIDKHRVRDQFSKVFTIGSKGNGQWRPIYIPPGATSTRYEPDICNGDGFLYWNCGKERGILFFNVEHEKFDFIKYPQEKMPASAHACRYIAQLQGQLSIVSIRDPSSRYDYRSKSQSDDIVITFWRLIDSTDNQKPVWSTKEVITCPFLNYEREWVKCNGFGLVSLVRYEETNLAQVVIDCYMLANGKQIELKVNNAQGIFCPRYHEFCRRYKFCPSKMVENIMPLKSLTVMQEMD